ncbi:fatty acyl-AMP ligase [Sphingobium sp. AN558]|uniref:fatty acyl-AMP ligase n=1 Tax=Sphingobium sp. AN558 TaxID=3133442 RepID=UPI0030C2196A
MQIDFSRSIIDVIVGHENQVPDRPALVFDLGDGPIASLTYAELGQDIRRLAGALVAQGLAGRRIALLFTASTEFARALLACFAVGSVAVPIAPMGRRKARLQNILSLLDEIRPDCILVDDVMAAQFGADLSAAVGGRRYLTFGALMHDAEPIEPSRLLPDQLALLQFTSGTTSRPKGVMITHGNIIANESMIQAAFGHAQDSHFVGWVPHYHDQGLFGNILQPLFLGSTCVITSPAAFINKPMSWLHLISRYRAHTSGGPNFGFDLCADYAERRGMPDVDLSCWRVAFNGAERVRPQTLKRFSDLFAKVGFDERAFLPCYGLAESTLVTIAMPPATAPLVKAYDSRVLAAGRAEESADDGASLQLTCCGPAMEGSEAQIVDPVTGAVLGNGPVGEIWVRGPHIAKGYIDNREATEATFHGRLDDGEPYLRTGDLGFSTADGFYIVGRLKDAIIVRGRNYAPSDVEHIWMEMSGTVGQAIAAAVQIDVGDEQHVALVVEVSRTEAREITPEWLQGLAGKLRARAMEQLELSLTDLVMVPAGSIPRTTSGKVQRRRTADMVMNRELSIVGIAGPLAHWNDEQNPALS